MERELLLPVKRKNNYNNIIDREIACIKKMFPYFESFETFTITSVVIDLDKKRFVHTRNRLRQIFIDGPGKKNRFVVCLN
ncbi:MAG: hypothetical protein JST21_02870 [Bacteroidetes bacterium]|nr:hypothetical protein [Bacteroidota bacterium]